MRVKWCAIYLRTCKINEIHQKLSKEYICLLFRWAASWIYESITHLLQEYPTGIHLLGKVMYQYYEDNYLAQKCNSRNIIYIAGYISGRTENSWSVPDHTSFKSNKYRNVPIFWELQLITSHKVYSLGFSNLTYWTRYDARVMTVILCMT